MPTTLQDPENPLQKTTIEELLEAGAHFGSWTHTWNPAMKPFIHGKRNKIHIINLVHTVRGLTKAAHFLREVAATGRQIVYVGTKRQMRGILLQEVKRVEMPWVTERWLGGTLTNFKTVRSRLSRLDELEGMEENGEMAALKKKAQSRLTRELRRIKKNLDGLRTLNRIPGAMVVVDPKREHIAVAEARRVKVPVIAILDTDCDPTPIDIPIPANDDSMRSVGLILGRLSDAIAEGQKRFKASGRAPEDATGVRDEGGRVHSMDSDLALAAQMKKSAEDAAIAKGDQTEEASAADPAATPAADEAAPSTPVTEAASAPVADAADSTKAPSTES
ncbi:MAG: small subunit ribosomal protein S2 [Pseudohongiellaceae bacterium]